MLQLLGESQGNKPCKAEHLTGAVAPNLAPFWEANTMECSLLMYANDMLISLYSIIAALLLP